MSPDPIFAVPVNPEAENGGDEDGAPDGHHQEEQPRPSTPSPPNLHFIALINPVRFTQGSSKPDCKGFLQNGVHK